MTVTTTKSSLNILLILVGFLSFSQCNQSNSISNRSCGDPDYIRDLNGKCVKRFKPKRIPCPEVEMRFGNHELKLGGRMVEVWCEQGWKLAPQDVTYVMCKLGRWDSDIPKCVRPGCQDMSVSGNVQMTHQMDGALAAFSCTSPDLELIGQQVLSCDGENWNGTVPLCRIKPTTTPRPASSTGKWLQDRTSGAGQQMALLSVTSCMCLVSIMLI